MGLAFYHIPFHNPSCMDAHVDLGLIHESDRRVTFIHMDMQPPVRNELAQHTSVSEHSGGTWRMGTGRRVRAEGRRENAHSRKAP